METAVKNGMDLATRILVSAEVSHYAADYLSGAGAGLRAGLELLRSVATGNKTPDVALEEIHQTMLQLGVRDERL